MPAQVADTLRPILEERIVGPAIAQYPFLEGELTLL